MHASGLDTCAKATEHAPKETAMITLQIDGMTCNHCVQSVKVALFEVPGVLNVDVDLAEGKAVVLGNVPADQLIAAVVEEGYHAKVLG